LEGALQDYLKKPSASPFDIGRVSTEAPKEEIPKGKKAGEAKNPDRAASAGGAASSAGAASSSYAEQLAQVPQLGALGPLFRSSRPQELTESETEYTVNCVKHIFAQHIVFQFNVNNTLNDQLLEDVTVKMEPEGEDFVIQQEIPCASLPYNVVGVTYVVVARSEEAYTVGT
jgi:coatomer protein complex subunit gamma